MIKQEGLKRLAESIYDETIFECSLQLWKLVPAFIFYLYQYLFLYSRISTFFNVSLDYEVTIRVKIVLTAINF